MNNFIHQNTNNSSDNENIDSLIENIQKLKIQLKNEEEKVKKCENILINFKKSQKINEKQNLNISREFNQRENDIKEKYKMYEEYYLDKSIKKGNLYDRNIRELNEQIKNIEYENFQINQKITELKNKNKILENQYNSILGNLENTIMQKDIELQELKEEMDLLPQEVINKEEAYDKKLKELNIKLINLKEINNNKLEILKKNIFNNKNKKRNLHKNKLRLKVLEKSNSNPYFKTDIHFYSPKRINNNSISKNNDNSINNINLRDTINILQIKTLKLTNVLSDIFEEKDELNKEYNYLKSIFKNQIEQNYNNNINNDSEFREINKKNNINKIVEYKMIINKYKNDILQIKMNLFNKNLEHKINVNETIISYENKIKKLREKINNLKMLKNDFYEISDEIKENLFDDY